MESWLDSEQDAETEDLMNIIDEGIESNHLFNMITSEDISTMDFLMRNQMLIEKDVINAKNRDGFTALHLASQKGLNSFCAYLFRLGASIDQSDSQGNTALHHAVSLTDNWNLVDELILEGANISVRNTNGETPLLLACSRGHLASIQSLMLHNADLKATDIKGLTSLHLAAFHGHPQVVEYILSNVDDDFVNVTDNHERTALHAAACIPKKQFAAAEQTIQILLANDASINDVDDKGRTPLFWAISYGNFQTCELLVVEGADLDIQDTLGRFPVHYAAYYNSPKLVQFFLSEGASVDCADSLGCTPLHAAVGSVDTVRVLLENGASPTRENENSRTPLHLALMIKNEESFLLLLDTAKDFILNGPDVEGRTLIHYCCSGNFVEAFQKLKDLGADDTQKDITGNSIIHFASSFGCTQLIQKIFEGARKHKLSSYITSGNCASQKPLHMAAAHGSGETCQFLLDNRASSWAPDRYGCTALHYAALFHNQSSLTVLTSLRDTKRMDKNGATPLHYAVLSGDIETISIFQNLSVDIDSKDNQGRTPIFYAPTEKTILYLQQYGLDISSIDNLGRNILFSAIQFGNQNLFQILVSRYNMDIYQRDNQGISLLHHAAYCGNVYFVRYLLDHSTLDPFVTDKENRTPLYFAAAAGRDFCLRELLGRLDKESKLRIVDERDIKGRSPLDAAAFGRHNDCILTLIDEMTMKEQYAPAKDGRNPLHVAVNNNLDILNNDVLLALLNLFDVNSADCRGRTCLHRTVYHNLPNYTRFLLENGANINAQDYKGLTPMMMATLKELSDVNEVLMEYQPDLSLVDKKGRTVKSMKDSLIQSESEGDEYDDEYEDEYEDDETPTGDTTSSTLKEIMNGTLEPAQTNNIITPGNIVPNETPQPKEDITPGRGLSSVPTAEPTELVVRSRFFFFWITSVCVGFFIWVRFRKY